MNLSARLIVYHLQKKYDMEISPRLSAEPCLKYPILCTDSAQFGKELIYIIDDPSIPLPSSHLSRELFLLTGNRFAVSAKDYPNLCILPASVSAKELLAYLLDIFQLYEQWNQSLFESRMENASIQSLLDLTDGIIPNPMIVINSDFTIIASKKASYGILKNSVLGSNEETRILVDSLKQDPNYEAARHRTGYFYYPGNLYAAPSLCVNIRKSSRSEYRLMITEGEVPLDDTFGFILEYLARVIRHAMTTTAVGQHVSRPLHQIFLQILTDPKADYVKISRQLSTAGWLSSHSYQCILIQTGLSDAEAQTLRSICSYIENSIPESCALEHQANVVAYINLDLCSSDWETIGQKLADFTKKSQLYAGCSRKMLGHFNFQRQYVQAQIALEMGGQQDPANRIRYFNPIALPYILKQATRKLPAYMICHEKLLSLKYADEANHTQLYQTIRCYLEHQQSVTRTAAALYIHRSTLIYRLKKIQEILQSDLSDPEEQLYLALSFHLMDLEDDKNSSHPSR